MLTNNPKLLAEFVSEELTEGHVKLIGNMINPPSIKERDNRLFLYEVSPIEMEKYALITVSMHAYNNVLT